MSCAECWGCCDTDYGDLLLQFHKDNKMTNFIFAFNMYKMSSRQLLACKSGRRSKAHGSPLPQDRIVLYKEVCNVVLAGELRDVYRKR